jgi:GINS complex subunit 1
MYGDAGNKLVSPTTPTRRQPPTQRAQVQHAKRAQSLKQLPPYQAELVRVVAREVRALDASVSARLAPFAGGFDPAAHPEAAAALLVEYVCMRRNKRCLLAYHRVRADKVQEMLWAGVDVLEGGGGAAVEEGGGQGLDGDGGAGAGNDGAAEAGLSPEEEEYARGYSELLAAFKGRWTDVDLTGSLEPPKDLFIDVRVLKDAGEIQTEYG